MSTKRSRLNAHHYAFGPANRLCAACTLWLVFSLCGACAPAAESQEYVEYDDPGGRFSISMPVNWEIDPTSSQYELFAGQPESNDAERFEATLGLTWGPPPCDRLMVDDPVGWYADLMCWGEVVTELSRTETQVDGRRALLVDCSVTMADATESRQLALLMEAYGIVWQVTCTAVDSTRFPAFEKTFRYMLQSLVIRGAWSGAAA